MSFKLPSFLIKKIFPPKKSVFTVDTNGDGKVDSLQIKAINMIQPFTIPKEINLDQYDIDGFDLSEYATFLLDDNPLELAKHNVDINVIKDLLTIHIKGESYTVDDIIVKGKLGGKLIAVGDTITVLLKIDHDILKKLDEGKHVFTIALESMPNIEIDFELNDKNMNIILDPSKI